MGLNNKRFSIPASSKQQWTPNPEPEPRKPKTENRKPNT